MPGFTTRSPGEEGQVYSQYIVGINGKAEPGSFRAYIATSDAYAREAQKAIANADFRPAILWHAGSAEHATANHLQIRTALNATRSS